MTFKEFRDIMQKHVSEMFGRHRTLFVTDTDKDEMWETYLNSFPPGTNEIFRERREHDCSCCRHFIKSFGNVVGITPQDELESIWDFDTNDATYQPVILALRRVVKRAPVSDVLVTRESGFGTHHNHEMLGDGTVRTWDHFRIDLPPKFKARGFDTPDTIKGRVRDNRNVFERSLTEISTDAIETVLDLIAQKSLYRGEEWAGPITQLKRLQDDYVLCLSGHESEPSNFCWRKSVEVGPAISKIKNHSIGVLLTDITEGMDLDAAMRRYEKIVAPTNYKRPKAIFTKKMVEQAEKTLTDLGLLGSLGRRFATIEDITVNNILFANRDSLKAMGTIFDEMKSEVGADPKRFDHVEEISVDHFLEHVLPRVTSIEAFLENRHSGNLVSVIAPQDKSAPTLFKWSNAFSWAYAGNVTDSMKERVKSKGGNVEGVLRFSLQWNENGNNQNDFDAHCIEPGGNHIFFPNKRIRHYSSGMLDVDIIHPGRDVAVENIAWTDPSRMSDGTYTFFVKNYSHNGGRSGFTAQIEFDGVTYEFEYGKELRQSEEVVVAEVAFSRHDGFRMLKSLPSTTSSRKVWGLDTQQFHPVSVFMFSPNYWDQQQGIGHRHYLFILKGCLNDTAPNGFYNEFLKGDLLKHKRVFEALGGKMRVAPSDNQLSGIGFSATKRDSLVCKLEGHTSRTVKIVF